MRLYEPRAAYTSMKLESSLIEIVLIIDDEIV